MIKDGDVRDTVESVINGAEDVLSFFFTNSSSALRRVKTRERKKRVNGASKSDSMTVHTTDCTSPSVTDSGAAAAAAAASLKSPLFSSQLNNKDFTQWTPLSLSDVQDGKTNQVCISKISSELASPCIDSSVISDDGKNPIAQIGRSSSYVSEQQIFSPNSFNEESQGRCSLPEVPPALTFARKPRKFVYRVQNSESKRVHSVAGMSFLCLYFFACSNFVYFFFFTIILNSKFVPYMSCLQMLWPGSTTRNLLLVTKRIHRQPLEII